MAVLVPGQVLQRLWGRQPARTVSDSGGEMGAAHLPEMRLGTVSGTARIAPDQLEHSRIRYSYRCNLCCGPGCRGFKSRHSPQCFSRSAAPARYRAGAVPRSVSDFGSEMGANASENGPANSQPPDGETVEPAPRGHGTPRWRPDLKGERIDPAMPVPRRGAYPLSGLRSVSCPRARRRDTAPCTARP